MYLHLDLGNNQFYTFVYTSAGNMFALSTNEAFNTPIAKTSNKKRSIKQNMWLTLYRAHQRRRPLGGHCGRPV